MRRSMSEPPQEFLSFVEQVKRFDYGSRGSPALPSRSYATTPSSPPRGCRQATPSSPLRGCGQATPSSPSRCCRQAASSPSRDCGQASLSNRHRTNSNRSLTVPQAPALATEGRSWVPGFESRPGSPETSVTGCGPRSLETSVRDCGPRRPDAARPAASASMRPRMSPKASPKPSPKQSPRSSPKPSSSPRPTPKMSPWQGSSPRVSPRYCATAIPGQRLFQAEVPRSRPAVFAYRAQVGDKQPWQALAGHASTVSGVGSCGSLRRPRTIQ